MTRMLKNMCISSSVIKFSGRVQWLQYFLAAHAAWIPFKLRLYASIKRRERFANRLMDAKGMESKASRAQTLLLALYLYARLYISIYIFVDGVFQN